MEKEGYREALAFLLEKFPGKAFLTVHEVSELLGIHWTSAYDAVKRKKNPIPSKKVGAKIIIPIPALARWMC